MKIKDKFEIDASHSIEWGDATWNNEDFSIRNRFQTEGGKFNKAGSSEIPWDDFKKMIKESIKRNHFSNAELSDFMSDIADYIKAFKK